MKKLVNGEYVDLTADEIAELERQAAELEAGASDRLAASIRKERDQLLAACDWTQVADAPVDQAAWATYRQALRDITAQAGFPDNITWPVNPMENN